MIFLSIGCLAFVLMLIADLNKIWLKNKYLNSLFIWGALLLLLASLAIALADYNSNNQIETYWRWVSLVLALLFLILLIYSLFGALPFKNTYIKSKRNAVVHTGMYALCRHPGVMWFFFFYLFIALALASNLLLIAALVWTGINAFYVFIQDRWIFPITLENYETYQQEVPFLLPDGTSLQNCIHYYWKKAWQ